MGLAAGLLGVVGGAARADLIDEIVNFDSFVLSPTGIDAPGARNAVRIGDEVFISTPNSSVGSGVAQVIGFDRATGVETRRTQFHAHDRLGARATVIGLFQLQGELLATGSAARNSIDVATTWTSFDDANAPSLATNDVIGSSVLTGATPLLVFGRDATGAAYGTTGSGLLTLLPLGADELVNAGTADNRILVGSGGTDWERVGPGYVTRSTVYGDAGGTISRTGGFESVFLNDGDGLAYMAGGYTDLATFETGLGLWDETGRLRELYEGAEFADFINVAGSGLLGLNVDGVGRIVALGDLSFRDSRDIFGDDRTLALGGFYDGSLGALWNGPGGVTISSFQTAAAPEPGTLALIGLALAGFGARRRK